MEAAAAHLLDFSKPFDVTLLDQICAIAMDGLHPQRPAASQFLCTLKDHPEMWKRADAILETSKELASKFFGLQVLSETINTRWKILPQDQREGIRNYIVGKIISLSNTDEQLKQNNAFLMRLNLVLVYILKQDWPHNWPTFVEDIVGSSKTSEALCENNMKILKLLSEEVFDFSKDTMTAAKMKSMKESLNDEFSQIFRLCEFILEASQKPSLVLATLQTLQRFLTWIPLGYIFETHIMPAIITNFFPVAAFRVATVDCLTEVASLPPTDVPENYQNTMRLVLVAFIQQLRNVVPIDVDMQRAFETGTEEECLFVKRLALFLSTYLKSYLPLFDARQPDGRGVHEDVVVEALHYLVLVSTVDDEEVFKTCLEFWHHFCKDLYSSEAQWKGATTPFAASGIGAAGTGGIGGMSPGLGGGVNSAGASPFHGAGTGLGGAGAVPLLSGARRSKQAVYETVLHRLRIVMIDKMAKPEEVIVVEDDNGEIVREMTKDTEVIAQYKTMREAIVFLTHLNYEDTETIMLEKLDLQVAQGKFSWNGLNTLCWAIGSISGAMGELDEKRFLVSVIKDLLKLCEEQRGKDNKAVVASNIMYIVGQYPRFLKAHWKFLKTVVNKLFEFMHEHHPGVQDMACDTFLKIAQKCKRKFMTPQSEDPQPFILSLIHDLRKHIVDLQPHQVQSFYESVATMLSDSGPGIRLNRDEVVLLLMDLPNLSWKAIIAEGARDLQTLLTLEAAKEIQRILKTNTRVCASAGSVFVHQLGHIFMDMMNVYQLYSTEITKAVQQQGAIATRLVLYKAMRAAKSEILELMTTFTEVSRESPAMMANFLPQLMKVVLDDYASAPPAARDSKVLALFSTAISVLRDQMSASIPHIMEAAFQPTLDMITANMLDYPEHRINFFKFLRDANAHCFYGLFSIAPPQQKLVVDSIVWAFKHTERNISETGLEILEELLQNIAPNPTISQPFYQSFLLVLIEQVMGVLTDRLHKSGFRQQASVLMHLFHLVQKGQVAVPLFNAAGPAADNANYLKEHVGGLLLDAFPNLTKSQVVTFVLGLFDVSKDINAFKVRDVAAATHQPTHPSMYSRPQRIVVPSRPLIFPRPFLCPFQEHLRDFLIAVKEFASEDNAELFAEEREANLELSRQEQWQYRASVPGLLKPSELADGDGDADG
jgi:exportin-1